jgi:multidrug efflux pump subunit AcrA (membrane-fusion protein)
LTMKALIDTLRSLVVGLGHTIRGIWRWYMRRGLLLKILIAAGLIGLLAFAFGSSTEETPDSASASGRFVTLAPVQELAGAGGGTEIIGTVRAVTGAEVLAQTGGTVTSVNTRIGASVPAGFVIANLENASERAAVLSAEGAYDAALAAREAQSLPDTEKEARDTYRSAYTTIDTVLENDLRIFFGTPTVYGPKFLVDSADAEDQIELSRDRASFDQDLASLQEGQATAGNRAPETLLDEAESVARDLQLFLNKISTVISQNGVNATDEQINALAGARSSINGTLSAISAARSGLRSGTIGATAGADASVKQALGALRAAQANLERTIVRAPIGGQIDFLPIRIGDYVTSLQHVASISQSGTLEVVAYVSEDERDMLTVGSTTTIDGTHTGIITTVAPALDPVTKQIEVRIAAEDAEGLVNGQSVRIALPNVEASTSTGSETLLLPLASVKLRAGDRIVFSLNAEGRLEAHPVEVGGVYGDRIEILSPLPPDLRIVTDARGLAEGELVRVSEEDN